MWSDRERVRTGTGIPSVFRSRSRPPNPLPTSVSAPTIYRSELRHIVPVPTDCRPVVSYILGFCCLAVCLVVTIPSRRLYTISLIPYDISVPFTIGCIFCQSSILQKIKIHFICDIEGLVETHLCKLCVILRSHVLPLRCPH